MSDRRYTCPHCKATYAVHTYSTGMSELIEMRCSSCPAVLGVHVISAAPLHAWPLRVLTSMPLVLLLPVLQFLGYQPNPYTPAFFDRLSKKYSPCACGGTFRHDAPHRCPSCLGALPRHELARQLGDFSGLYTTSFREV